MKIPQELTTSEKLWLRNTAIVFCLGCLIWLLALFIADAWMEVDQNKLVFPLGPMRTIWLQNHGPGLIPILIILGAFVFYIISLIQMVNVFKDIVRTRASDEFQKAIVLGATNIFFVLLFFMPFGYTLSVVYENFMKW